MIKQRTKDGVHTLIKHDVLTGFKNKSASLDQFLFFTVQKALITCNTSDFVFDCVLKAKQINNKSLLSVLMLNYLDEIGADENGKIINDNIHAVWRQDYLDALGIADADIDRAKGNTAEANYNNRMQQFVDNAKPLVQIGAFLMLERLIPLEYRAMKSSRDALFPNIFIVNAGDSEAVVQSKAVAARYIDAHITHDAQFHFPILVNALNVYQNQPQRLTEILAGIDFMVEARLSFYDDVFSQWSHANLAA